MPAITEAARLEWEDKPTPREGRIQRKALARGDASDPDNFEFNIYRFFPGYSTPRHRHNWEQFRFGLASTLTYDPGKEISDGTLVYFPEGAYYGPQESKTVSDVLLLQYGGASAQGYLSQEQLIAARAVMATTGEFRNGVYTWYDKDGTKHNQDASEAVWEHVFQKKIRYVKPRIPESVKMDPAAYDWLPAATAGLEEKLLGVFTERKVQATMLRAVAPTRLTVARDDRDLLFTLAGDFRLAGRAYGPHTALFSERGEELELQLEPGFEGLLIRLPNLRRATA